MKNALIKNYFKENCLRIIFSFSNNYIIKNFYNNDQLSYRIKNIYEIISYDKGDLKKRILKYSNKKINISSNFRKVILNFSQDYNSYIKYQILESVQIHDHKYYI